MTSSLQPKLHYDSGDGHAACMWSAYKPWLTARPMRVTCTKCKRTRAYKEMMGL